MKTQHGIALITGASSGIGATYAERLAYRGYDLLLVARDRARLAALADRLTSTYGIKAEILPADLTVPAELAVIENRLRTDSHIALLLNNAGVGLGGDIVNADVDRLQKMIELNVLAPSRLTVAAVTAFVERGHGGTIINIASVTALAPERFNGPYSGSKAYLLNLSLKLHQEVAPKGVRVQVVLPGATRTEIWDRAGIDIARLPASSLMDVDEMVDAALAGLDQGEVVTIPALPDVADWQAFTDARLKLGPNLSRDHAAPRYGSKQPALVG